MKFFIESDGSLMNVHEWRPIFFKKILSLARDHMIPLAIILCVTLPFLFFLVQIKELSFPESSKLLQVLFSTFLQAFLSLALSLAVALPLSLGLIAFSNKPFYYNALEWILLLPLLLPAIVILGGVMNIFQYFHLMPFGLFPVILSHSLIYSGALAVWMARLFMSKTLGLCEWASVQGVSRWNLAQALIRFCLRRDIGLICLTVFFFCFTSFSVPVLVGGSTFKVLEVAIYDYLKEPHLHPLALGLLLLEILFIFTLSLLIFKSPSPLGNLKSIPYLSYKGGILLGVFPVMVLCWGLLEGVFSIQNILFLESTLEAVLSTFLLGLGVGFGILFFLIIISFFPLNQYLKKILIGYGAPSVVLTGFSFIILFDKFPYFSWIMGLLILFLPSLYRWIGDFSLKSIQNQIQVAFTFGAGMRDIFLKIIWPQCGGHFLLASSVAAFWASGEFAFTMMTSQGKDNLAILAQQFLQSYYFKDGLAMIWLIILIGSLLFIFFNVLLMKIIRILSRLYESI